MQDCPHCELSLDTEEDVLRHVADEHPDEMGAIERRRLQDLESRSLGRRAGVVAGVAISLVVAAVFFYYLVFADLTDIVQPTDRGAVEEYGTIEVTVDGEPVNLSQQEYLEADPYWYLDPETVGGADEGYVWEKHGRDVTLEYALLTIGVDVGATPANATIREPTAEAGAVDGERGERSFDVADGDTVEVTVDGEQVDPREHRLQGADSPGDAGDGERIEVVLEGSG